MVAVTLLQAVQTRRHSRSGVDLEGRHRRSTSRPPRAEVMEVHEEVARLALLVCNASGQASEQLSIMH